jgi:hypothetical protein
MNNCVDLPENITYGRAHVCVAGLVDFGSACGVAIKAKLTSARDGGGI